MQPLKAKRNFQIETYTAESDFLHDPSFFKRIEQQRDAPLNVVPAPKPAFHFSEKTHPFDEYIEISDRFFLKILQSSVERKSSRKYVDYKIEQDDTLYGVALKFDISPEIIKNLNFLTEDSGLFPGQIISIPVNEDEKEEKSMKAEKMKSFKLEEIKDWLEKEDILEETKEERESRLEDMLLRRKSSDRGFITEKMSFKSVKKEASELENLRYEVYYCTSYGDIKGVLTINEFLLIFDPLVGNSPKEKSPKKEKNDDRFTEFQVCLDLRDIVDAFLLSLPNKYCDEQYHHDQTKRDYNKDFFLEINIGRIGDEAIEKKYHERIKDMEAERLPLATIFFKIYDKNFEEELKNQQKQTIASEIQKKLTEKMKLAKAEHSKNEKGILENSTKIPFFDILYENLFKTSAKKGKKTKRKSILKNLNLFGVIPADPKEILDDEDRPEYIPKLIEDSNILTNDHFLQILHYIPPSLKLRNWKLVYSNTQHGTSLNTLFYRCEEIGPNIVVVQDFKNWVFGAYCSDSWSRGQSFHGKGETFLFTFKDGRKMTPFLWSGKNYDFQFSDSDGLAVGAGDNYGYGFFVKGDLLSGRSHTCETFDNQVLSEKNDFDIRFIEIWGCDEFIDI